MPTARTETSSRRKSSSRSGAKAASGPNALTLLREDHTEVSEMFEKFEKRKDKMTSTQKQTLVEEICAALTVHAQIEEEIFYPAVRPEIDDEDLMDEAVVEHQSLKELIAKIEDEGPEGEYYDAHVIVLGEYVKHHVKEEQGEMFKKVRATDIDLKELGGRLEQRKMELMGEAEEEE
ncbi:MAG: Hemerythrin cation binding domain protein [Alphaproteobacteria bacterium]|nr:Hemerythrin cation binding domain protein [Alphaproteobacteria bacterium]